MKIAFTGPSGAGKTAIRETVNKLFNFDTIDGSPSRIIQHKYGIPKTHIEIIQSQISMFLTKEQLETKECDNLIIDRCYIDSYLYLHGKITELGSDDQNMTYLEKYDILLNDYKDRCINNDKKYDVIFLIEPFTTNFEKDVIRTEQYQTKTFQEDYLNYIKDLNYDNLYLVKSMDGDINKRSAYVESILREKI